MSLDPLGARLEDRTVAGSGSRRTKVPGTHWLRHSFAHEALRCDNTDTGLKLTQQLLGHKNINTTAGYLQQNQSERVKAALKINPLGL